MTTHARPLPGTAAASTTRPGGGPTTFDAALRDALVRRGLPLGRVQARLAAAGHPVAMSTISQWQHGHRTPRSPRSLAVVDELEKVLYVSPGSLRRLARTDVPRSTAAPQVVSYASAFAGLLARLGTTSYGALQTVGCHDRIRIDARGALSSRSTTATMRAADTTDRHVIAHAIEPGGDIDLVDVTVLRGCRLGRVVRDAEAGVLAAELRFDRHLTPGDTVVHELRIDDGNGVPCHDYYRWQTHEVALLVLEVSFDRAYVPCSVAAFERATSDAPDRATTELSFEGGDRVHLVRQPAGPGVHGIRWAWPTRRGGGTPEQDDRHDLHDTHDLHGRRE